MSGPEMSRSLTLKGIPLTRAAPLISGKVSLSGTCNHVTVKYRKCSEYICFNIVTVNPLNVSLWMYTTQLCQNTDFTKSSFWTLKVLIWKGFYKKASLCKKIRLGKFLRSNTKLFPHKHTHKFIIRSQASCNWQLKSCKSTKSYLFMINKLVFILGSLSLSLHYIHRKCQGFFYHLDHKISDWIGGILFKFKLPYSTYITGQQNTEIPKWN